MEMFSKNGILQISDLGKPSGAFCRTDLEKMGTENDRGPFKRFLKILNMGSVSIENMKWGFCNMDHIFLKNIKGDLLKYVLEELNTFHLSLGKILEMELLLLFGEILKLLRF